MSKKVKTPGFWEQWSWTCKTILLGAMALVSGAGAHPADPSASLAKYSLYATDSIWSYDNVKTPVGTTAGGWSGTGGGWLLKGGNDSLFGPVYVNRKLDYSISWSPSTVIFKEDVRAGQYAGDPNATFAKSKVTGSTALEAMPNYTIVPGTESCDFNGSIWVCTGSSGGNVMLQPGKYKKLSISAGVAQIRDSLYEVDTLDTKGIGRLSIVKPAGKYTRILVKSDLKLYATLAPDTPFPNDTSATGTGCGITVAAGASQYGSVLIYYTGTKSVHLIDGSRYDLTLMAPNATVTTETQDTLNGQLFAKKIGLHWGFNGKIGTFVAWNGQTATLAFPPAAKLYEDSAGLGRNQTYKVVKQSINLNPALTATASILDTLKSNYVGRALGRNVVFMPHGSTTCDASVIAANKRIDTITINGTVGSPVSSADLSFCVFNDTIYPGRDTLTLGFAVAGDATSQANLQLSNNSTLLPYIDNDPAVLTPNTDTTIKDNQSFIRNLTQRFSGSSISGYPRFSFNTTTKVTLTKGVSGSDTVVTVAAKGPAFLGTDSVIVTATYQDGSVAVDTFVVTVEVSNTAPLIQSSQASISQNEDFAGSVDLRTYFTAKDDQSKVSWRSWTKTGGVFSLNSTTADLSQTSTYTTIPGTLTITNIPNANGIDTVFVEVTDSLGLKDTAQIAVNINAVNDAPVGTDKAYSTNEDVTLNVAANGILAGATDVEGNTITAGIKTVDVKHGTLTINSDGSLSYVPTLNFNGLDTAKVQIADGNGGLDTIQVVFTVNAVNDAPLGTDTTYSTNEDVTLNVAAAGVLSGATDVEGNTITVATKVVDVKHGALTANADGSVVYVPNANFFGADTARLQIADGQGGLDTIQVVINVNSVNDIPVGTDKSYSINEDETLNVSAATGALSGATDADGDALTASKIVNVKNGTLTVNADGSMVYVPNLNFNGLDTAKVQIADGNGGLDTVQVVFTVVAVNDAPLGTDKTYSTNEDVTFNLAATGVLSGATDVEGNAITVATKVVDMKHGALTANADGSVVYVPNANFFGADTARLQIADGQGGLDTILVVIHVNEVNDTATALGPKSNNLAENSVAGTLVARLTTTDAADALVPETFSYSLVDPANNDGVQFRISGDSLLVASGAVLNFESKSVLKLVVKSTDRGGNGIAIQDTITVNLTDVNETPVRTAHLADMNLQEEFADTTVADLSTKFSDPDAGDVIGYTVSTSNNKLSAHLSGTNLVLKSAKDSVGATLVYITATDKAGLKAYDTLTVNIANVNDNPVLNDSNYSITENSAIGTFVGKLNPYDVDVAMGLGDALTLTQLSNSKLFVIRGDSILSRAELDYEAVKSDTLMVEVSDKAGLKDTARVIVNINNVIEKSRLNLTGVNSTFPTQNAWIAVRDTVLGHVTITHGNSGVKGLDSLWTKDTSFVLHYTEDGRIVDSNLTLGSELSSKGYGTQIVNRIYQNPTKDLADTITFVIAYNTKIPTLAIDTTVKKFKKDSNGRIWVNDSIMKRDQGKFDWDISTVGSDPFVRVKIDSVVRAQLSEGENKLIVAYTDRYGNVGFDTVRVMVDTKYPLVRIDSPRGPKGEDTSKVFSLGVGVNWTVDGVKQTLDTIQGLVEGANVIVRGNCDYAGNCAYDTVWVDALFEDNRIKVQVKDAIIGLTNGKVISDDEQAQKEQEYYQERNQARGESEVIPTQEGYNLTLINTQTGKSEEIVYYNGSNQKKIDSNRRVGLDTNLSIGPRVKVTMQFPLIDDSVGSCKDGKPMWEFNVNAIDANIYDQIGQFVSSVHVPGFVVDKKAYQQSATDASPGTVEAFLELPKVRNDMRSLTGRRWGDGVYLINIRVRTTAKGINCNEGKLNPASISTMTKVGYVRAK